MQKKRPGDISELDFNRVPTLILNGQVWRIIKDLHHQSPYAKVDTSGKWRVPFHHKVGVWRLVKAAYQSALSNPSQPSMLSRPPCYSTFRRVLRMPEFKKVVFHRMVDIGRCPKCQYFEWKCASVDAGFRGIWQEALAKHHMLQIQQKRKYVEDRTAAAASFPLSELYLAMDCGSGQHFVLPHLSPADCEGPSKEVDGFATIPMKVCNGLVHGDHRSHVILSPGTCGATANHTCECVGIMINKAFEEHGDRCESCPCCPSAQCSVLPPCECWLSLLSQLSWWSHHLP